MVTQDLAAARAELARLQNRERELVEELRSVRTAAQVQLDRINVFIKRRLTAPITRLPLSVLSDIIYLTICNTYPESDAHRYTKRKLASVSRLWRDAILNFPKLWTTVVIDPSWSAPLVMAHVKRSGECPLDITIAEWSSNDRFQFQRLLGPAVTCGYRWRSLVIREISGATATLILNGIQYMRFPAMKRIEISEARLLNSPFFLTSQYAPALEQVILSKGSSIEKLPFITTLRIVHLHLTDDTSASLLLSSLLPLPQLSELVLSGTGDCDEWPDAESIRLPVLTSLTLILSDPLPALVAMVAPSLIYLRCSRGRLNPQLLHDRGGHWAHIFRDLPNKFATVRHLCLSDATSNSSSAPVATEADAQAVCAACPGVYQAEVPAHMINVFFAKDNAPADRWKDLKCLTFKGLTVGTIPHKLKGWFSTRKSNKMPRLNVTFCEFKMVDTPTASSRWPASLYELLYGYCELELKEVPLKATLNVDSSTPLVDLRGTSKVYDSLGMVKTRYMWCCECYDLART
ncbi:hypothetical protein EDC04DRAFT_2089420 [Pisolithus marmoratus]|nr:hypothetical protein EDC04DRAFT_2089420 [Pisolithus marmoratus]